MLSAVSAYSSMRATNMESTTLYSACTSMEIMIGTLIVASSLPTGMTPILFSCCLSIRFLLLKEHVFSLPFVFTILYCKRWPCICQ